MDTIINDTKNKLENTIEHLHDRLSIIIATGAHPTMLKNVMVKYYEEMTPLNQIANIKATDATMLVVTPFDRNVTKDIVEGINKSDLGLNPVDEGGTIRIMVSPITLEKREIFAKDAKHIGEEARISVRNIRTEANKRIKSLEVSENEERLGEDQVQKLVDDYNKQIEKIIKEKVEDLTKI